MSAAAPLVAPSERWKLEGKKAFSSEAAAAAPPPTFLHFFVHFPFVRSPSNLSNARKNTYEDAIASYYSDEFQMSRAPSAFL